MKGGQVGKKAPTFTEKEDGRIETCTVTVQKKIDSYIGDYTATVYFSEYDKGRDNWKTKPRTMIAKVAEMHALRMAFPEELSETYIEDEFREEKNYRVGTGTQAPTENTAMNPKAKIIFILRTLGVPYETKDEITESVKKQTDLELVEENYDEIVCRLEVVEKEKRAYENENH